MKKQFPSRQLEINPPQREEEPAVWQKLKNWWQQQRLKQELAESQRFQRECVLLGCVHLAELEKSHTDRLQRKLLLLRSRAGKEGGNGLMPESRELGDEGREGATRTGIKPSLSEK